MPACIVKSRCLAACVYIPYTAKLSRGKTFAVVRKIHYSLAVHQAVHIMYCTQQVIQGKNFRDRLKNCKNRESFPPQNFCRIRYIYVAICITSLASRRFFVWGREKKRLVTLAKILWTLPECWQSQSNRLAPNCVIVVICLVKSSYVASCVDGHNYHLNHKSHLSGLFE